MANLKNILLWVHALEDGMYKQATQRLHAVTKGGYCCLGVACLIAEQNGVELRRETVGDPLHDVYETFNDEGFIMPAAVSYWLGLAGGNPKLCGRDASWWNDRANVNFKGLAELIRQEFGLDRKDDWTLTE